MAIRTGKGAEAGDMDKLHGIVCAGIVYSMRCMVRSLSELWVALWLTFHVDAILKSTRLKRCMHGNCAMLHCNE